ncbi:DUF2802 domain-containing protein [Shewanella sp.]|uniref:DUF2802 domain-containing protein n=1 Tax=Shewanella sp. TaxID=50422 RepID=UPI003567F8EC
MVDNGFLIGALIYVIACLALVLFQQKQLGKLRNKVDALALLLKESDNQRDGFKRELHELRSGTIGVGKRVLELEKKLAQQNARIDEAREQDPQARLYSRAMKMVSLGAGIDELVAECELPRAEAELLLRLHGNR